MKPTMFTIGWNASGIWAGEVETRASRRRRRAMRRWYRAQRILADQLPHSYEFWLRADGSSESYLDGQRIS